MSSPYIRLEQIGCSGHVILDRPHALNALDHAMVRTLRAALDRFAAEPSILRVIIRSSSPRAFCAGGDMRRIRELVLAGAFAEALGFFADEFALNLAIAQFPKPYIALIQGICMGGGLGLSVHGRYRILAESAKLAMPETAIGYFADVGATYFLNALPGLTGRWLALTGTHLSGEDAVAVGLGTHLVTDADLPALIQALSWSFVPLEEILASFALPANGGVRQRHGKDMDAAFAHATVEAIQGALIGLGTPFAREAHGQLARHSPHGLHLTLDLMARGASADLASCLAHEFSALPAVLRHPDFAEGVRAVLVDKDRRPRWSAL